MNCSCVNNVILKLLFKKQAKLIHGDRSQNSGCWEGGNDLLGRDIQEPVGVMKCSMP